jgi:hypothetical protein
MPAAVQAETLVDLFDVLHAADDRLVAWLDGDDRLAGAVELPREDQLAGAGYLIEDVSDGDPPVTRLQLAAAAVPGEQHAEAQLELVLGSFDPYEPNHVTFWPVDTAERLLADRARAEALLRAVVTLLDPHWAVWTTDEILARQPRRPDGPLWGWITYVAHRLGRRPAGQPAPAGFTLFHRGQLTWLAHDARDLRGQPVG